MEYVSRAHDGVPIWVRGELPKFLWPQKHVVATIKDQVAKKGGKVRRWGYIWRGLIHSLTRFFSVSKGNSNICMVYDTTESGPNDALWVPTFSLPMVDHSLAGMEPGYFLGDTDLREMFLNFQLDLDIHPYGGIDISSLFEEKCQGEVIWAQVFPLQCDAVNGMGRRGHPGGLHLPCKHPALGRSTGEPSGHGGI